MEKVFSIRELENMIACIKKNNPNYNKRIKKYACGIFKFEEYSIIQHRHIGIHEFKTINY